MEWSVYTAQQYAVEDRLDEWVHAYLEAGDWINRGLSQGLRKQPRWWAGPGLVPIKNLVRKCGPEDGMEFQIPLDAWEAKTSQMALGLDDPMKLPPAIIQYIDGKLSLCDGTHRSEAARKKGWSEIWAVIWFDSEEEWRAEKSKWNTYSHQLGTTGISPVGRLSGAGPA